MAMNNAVPPRRLRAVAWLILACLLFLPPALSQAQEALSYTLDIAGAGRFEPLLEEHLEISRRRKDSGLPLDEVQRLVDIAPEQIRGLLATEGRFSPVIRAWLERDRNPPAAHIEIDPGPATTVDAIEIRFKGAIASGPRANSERIERLRRAWRLDPGEVFRQKAWTEAKDELLKALLIRDYPAATISHSEARIDPRRNSATLTIEVDSGPAFTFGELQIQGLQRYSRSMVDALNPIKPGDAYSQEKLNDLQSRLEDSGYFRSAFATVDIDPARPDMAPVRVDLTENPRKRLALGVGFSTDTGARLQAKWLDRNFLMRDWRLESELRIDRDTSLLGGDVFLPALDNGWLPSFGVHAESTTSSGETDDKLRTTARIASPDKRDEKAWAVSFLMDRQRIGDVFLNNRQAVIASFTYTKRRLDHPLVPRRGYVASVELGAGPRGLVNESNIGRVVSHVTWLEQPLPRWQTVLRAQAGQVFGGSRLTVPGDLLFRTGGDQTVRGYGYNTLGVTQNGAVVGGTVTAVLSAELVYLITPQWGAAVFSDAGNAADSWSEFRFKRGSGIGARWRSPLGPINIDLAYGHATHQPRLHFSIGYGF
jgi:translocation and assembly module TamA